VVSSGALGPVVDFEPSGTAFATSATMTIPVQLPQGVDASRVGVMAVEASGAIRTIVPVVVSNGFATFPGSGFTHSGCFDRGEDGNHDDGGCTPTCGDDAECGASDGCGGTCDRNCHTDGGCTPTCGDDAECGASDGCGGTCDRNCHTDGGCTPTCGDSAECGASDGCGGTCDRNCGTDGGGCRPSCGDEAACGSSDGCGGVCEENCGDGGDGCSSTETLCAGDGGLYCANLNESATDCGACRNACGEAASECVRGVCACPDGGLLCGEPDAG